MKVVAKCWVNYDGVHNWEYWHQAIRMALPFASRNFKTTE